VSNPSLRAIKLAVRILGGEAEACSLLRATAAELQLWLSGETAPPVEALMRVLDVILDDPALAARHAVLLAAHDKERGL
jgi:hypothetical protein